MNIIYLASGKSSRMAPIGDKHELVFHGRPLMEHIMETLVSSGFTKGVVVSHGENHDLIRTVTNTLGMSITIIDQEDMEAGMAGAVGIALEHVPDEEPILVVGGNDYVDPSLSAGVVEKLLTEKKEAVIGAYTVDAYFPGGYLVLQEDGETIHSITEKPGEGNEPSNLVNMVCHAFSKAGLLKQALQQATSEKDDLYEQALQILFNRGHASAYPYTGIWKTIKYPWHVLDMWEGIHQKELRERTASDRIHPSAIIADDAEIGPEVIIGPNVRVYKGACVTGKSYIGAHTVIGNYSLVRDSHVGNQSEIGYTTEVARSYLGNNVSAHRAYIGDSVVEGDANFGAYSCTANLRLDKKPVKVTVKDTRISSGRIKCGSFVGKGAQIGIHASLMPGAKVVQNEKVFPGSIHT